MKDRKNHSENQAKETVRRKKTTGPGPVGRVPSTPTLQADMPTLRRAVENPGAAAPRDILTLQRLYGNRTVTRLLQARLTVGPVGDGYEREADHVADRVMTMQLHSAGREVQRQEEEEEIQTKPLASSITPLVQRQEEEEEIQTKPLLQRQEDEEEIQTKSLFQTTQPSAFRLPPSVQGQEEEEEIQTKPAAAGSFQAGESFERHLGASQGGGSPLPGEVRTFMEPRFGADFGGVRVHADAAAGQLNREINA